MLHYCDEHINAPGKEEKDKDGKEKEEPKRDDTFQAFAVIGIALIAMGEDIGAEMSLRQFNHLVRITMDSFLARLTLVLDALRRACYSESCSLGHRSRQRLKSPASDP